MCIKTARLTIIIYIYVYIYIILKRTENPYNRPSGLCMLHMVMSWMLCKCALVWKQWFSDGSFLKLGKWGMMNKIILVLTYNGLQISSAILIQHDKRENPHQAGKYSNSQCLKLHRLSVLFPSHSIPSVPSHLLSLGTPAPLYYVVSNSNVVWFALCCEGQKSPALPRPDTAGECY